MIERAFEYLFVLALIVPPAAVVLGALALVFGGRRRDVAVPTSHPARV